MRTGDQLQTHPTSEERRNFTAQADTAMIYAVGVLFIRLQANGHSSECFVDQGVLRGDVASEVAANTHVIPGASTVNGDIYESTREPPGTLTMAGASVSAFHVLAM